MQALFQSAQHIYEKRGGSGAGSGSESVPLTNGSRSGSPTLIKANDIKKQGGIENTQLPHIPLRAGTFVTSLQLLYFRVSFTINFYKNIPSNQGKEKRIFTKKNFQKLKIKLKVVFSLIYLEA